VSIREREAAQYRLSNGGRMVLHPLEETSFIKAEGNRAASADNA
jgi:hypothetical protein